MVLATLHSKTDRMKLLILYRSPAKENSILLSISLMVTTRQPDGSLSPLPGTLAASEVSTDSGSVSSLGSSLLN